MEGPLGLGVSSPWVTFAWLIPIYPIGVCLDAPASRKPSLLHPSGFYAFPLPVLSPHRAFHISQYLPVTGSLWYSKCRSKCPTHKKCRLMFVELTNYSKDVKGED